MNFKDLTVGKIYYSQNENKAYKVLAIGENWVCVISYSFEHCIAYPSLHEDVFFNCNDLEEDKREETKDVFDNLRCIGFSALKPHVKY